MTLNNTFKLGAILTAAALLTSALVAISFPTKAVATTTPAEQTPEDTLANCQITNNGYQAGAVSSSGTGLQGHLAPHRIEAPRSFLTWWSPGGGSGGYLDTSNTQKAFSCVHKNFFGSGEHRIVGWIVACSYSPILRSEIQTNGWTLSDFIGRAIWKAGEVTRLQATAPATLETRLYNDCRRQIDIRHAAERFTNIIKGAIWSGIIAEYYEGSQKSAAEIYEEVTGADNSNPDPYVDEPDWLIVVCGNSNEKRYPDRYLWDYWEQDSEERADLTSQLQGFSAEDCREYTG